MGEVTEGVPALNTFTYVQYSLLDGTREPDGFSYFWNTGGMYQYFFTSPRSMKAMRTTLTSLYTVEALTSSFLTPERVTWFARRSCPTWSSDKR